VRVFFSVVRSPLLLLPALIAILANLVVFYLLLDPIVVLVSELIAGSFLGIGFLGGNPLFFVSSFAAELLWVLVLVLVSIMINAWLGLVMARFAQQQEQKKVQVLESTRYAIKKIPRIIAWSIFVFLIAVFFFVVLLVFSAIGEWNAIIGWILLLLWLIIAIFTFLVFSLAIPAMGIEDCNIKKGLLHAREVIQKNLWNFIGFFIILGIVVLVIQLIGSLIADGIEDEIISVIIIAVFLLFQVIFSHLALPFYYLEKKQS
ncbi:hypothetical protein KKE06_04875, partial [Candidatus Micrarchaeota archaeon]|nr:hypothetical protein [Candidatus Micrarchaeota archaeon]